MVTDSPREEIHVRRLDIRFYRRADGLMEVEGRLVDTKTHPFRRQLSDCDMAPGAPLHDIVVRLVLDAGLCVVAATATYHAAPFTVCQEAARTLGPLVGLVIGAGWNKRVRELLGGAASCTHIVELLGPMATVVLQGLAPQRLESLTDPANEAGRRSKVDSCQAYAATGTVVARLWPHLHIKQAG